MTDTRSKARAYAEDTLGVNQVWTDAAEAQLMLNETMSKLVTARKGKREQEDLVTDLEMLLAEAERGKHPEMSVAAMERHLKALFHNDAGLITARSGLRTLVDEIDELEFLRSSQETLVKVLTARMMELGGYLQYLAATARRAATHETEATREAGETK